MPSPVRVMGVDLGTTKVSAIIAEVDKSGKPIVTGVGTERCEGIRKGVIVDVILTDWKTRSEPPIYTVL